MPSSERKPLFLTQHAQDVIDERALDPKWIVRTIRTPEWVIPDPDRPGVERRFRSIPEYSGRTLRVACYEPPVNIRILTVFFDRNARRPG